MAGKTYNSIEEYIAAVEAALPKVLEEYFAPHIEDVLKKHVQSDIYDAYTPKEGGWINGTTYQRRHSLLNTIESQINGNVMATTSSASPSPSVRKGSVWGSADGAFFDLLASGNMGIWRGGFPRPAVERAQAEIDGEMAFLEGLLQKGLEAIVG